MKPIVLDRRILLQTAELLSDDLQDTYGFVDLAEVFAARLDVPAARQAEAVAAGQTVAIATVEFIIRWSEDVEGIDAKDRLEYPVGSGDYWYIQGKREVDGRRNRIGLRCTMEADKD